MIYLLEHYGFCNGVKNSIEILIKACKENKGVTLLHPLMHNDIEVEKLQNEYHFRTGKDDMLSNDAIVFSAHGHTKEEEEKYPSRIIGTISEVPNYEEWGTGKVKINGRVWIRIK